MTSRPTFTVTASVHRRGRIIRTCFGAAIVTLFALVPLLHLSVGPLLPGPIDSVGSLNLIANMMVIGALAMTLYLLIGVTGMLSFGHALYFAVGAYGTVIITNLTDISFVVAAAIAVLLSVLIAALANGLALRAGIIGYSMITLAFGELLHLTVQRGYLASGGDQGVTLLNVKIPEPFRGLANIANIYWLCLLLVVVIYAVIRIAESRMRFGRVWLGIRENWLRAETLGFNVYGYKLIVSVIASGLASVCGVIYALLSGGAQPDFTTVLYSLGLVLMVILGGRRVLWGALLGGMLYTYLTLQLPALARSDLIVGLPHLLKVPMSQPEFILGLCFVLVILFLPGGIASGLQRLGRWLMGLTYRNPADKDNASNAASNGVPHHKQRARV